VITSPRRAERRVVVVEDHHLFAEAMDLALSVAGYDVRRVQVSTNPAAPLALVTAIAKHHPAVVLLDLDLGAFGDGGRLVEPITQSGAHVVVVTGSNDRARWGAAVQAGARKVLSKTSLLHEVIATVRRISTGLPVMDREERDQLIAEWRDDQVDREGVRSRLDQLTIRESEVLAHLMRGRAVRQIAGLSAVSEATVRTQVKSILAKLEVSSQLAAVGLANEIGWRAPVGHA
jgi:two-component system, NarL family, nitrate/nitrite response regulator NarL